MHDTSFELQGASVLVLGATGVLGGHLAARLHAKGARLTLTGRSADRLAEVAQALPGSAALVADLRDEGTGDRLVTAATAHGGGLGLIVNAAGVVAFGELRAADPSVMEDLFLTNVLGPMWVVRAAVAPLIAAEGVVCHITGVVAEQPLGQMAAYSASKAALSAACTALNQELGPRGVTVIDARPGHTETGLAGRALEGRAPALPAGLDPSAVAARIVEAIVARQQVVRAADFR